MRVWVGLGIAAMAVMACSSSGTTGPGATFRYSGNHTITIVQGNSSISVECTLAISTNAEQGAFTGTLTLDPCGALELTETINIAIQGTITGQTVTFTFPLLSQFVDGFEDQTSCTATRVDGGFAGTVVSGRIQAAFTADFTCEEGPGSLTWTVDVTKES